MFQIFHWKHVIKNVKYGIAAKNEINSNISGIIRIS